MKTDEPMCPLNLPPEGGFVPVQVEAWLKFCTSLSQMDRKYPDLGCILCSIVGRMQCQTGPEIL